LLLWVLQVPAQEGAALLCAWRWWRIEVAGGSDIVQQRIQREGNMAGMSAGILVGFAVLLLAATLLVVVLQLRAMRREVEATRLQLAKMDWGVMLLNGVQQLKQATVALEQIDKRLQKLEAIEKVQLSHINLRQGQ